VADDHYSVMVGGLDWLGWLGWLGWGSLSPTKPSRCVLSKDVIVMHLPACLVDLVIATRPALHRLLYPQAAGCSGPITAR